MKTSIIHFSFLTSLFIGTSDAATVFFDDFNSYAVGTASSDATYASRYSNTATTITITDGTGLNSTNAWSNSGDNSIVRKDTGIDFVNGGSILTASVFFQYNGTGGLAGPQIGFVLAANGNVSGGGDLTGRLSANVLTLRKNNANVSTGATLALTSANWYQLVYTLERTTTTDTFSLGLALYNATSAGAVGTLVGSHTDTTTDATFYTDNSIYFILRENTSISAMDNFEVTQVPEPGSAFLASLAVTGLLVRRKRLSH